MIRDAEEKTSESKSVRFPKHPAVGLASLRRHPPNQSIAVTTCCPVYLHRFMTSILARQAKATRPSRPLLLSSSPIAMTTTTGR